jgi:hypothetical protein
MNSPGNSLANNAGASSGAASTDMTRRQFIRRSVFSSAGIAGTFALGSPLPNEFGPAATGGKKQRKPNVIFIIADDQKLGSFGFLDKKALTPNIE